MEKEFIEYLFEKHHNTEDVATTKSISAWALNLFNLLFPERVKVTFWSKGQLENEFRLSKEQLENIILSTDQCKDCHPEKLATAFFNLLPELYQLLETDLEAILDGDPAARSRMEIIKVYPGFFAIFFYRVAHNLYRLNISLIPRILTEYAHSRTGIDIHPGAEIGQYFFIDHGTGIVIGETSKIGSHVKLYQGVTLGALSVDKNLANTKRHPTVEDNVIIYAGATILGGETVIGADSIIGGNVWLTKSVAPHSTVYHKPEIHVINHLEKA